MRFNDHTLKHLSRQGGCDKEGRLYYKGIREGYKERWFSLKGNLLFYYKTNQRGGPSDLEAMGVLVLERFTVKMEPISDRPFVFSITFDGDGHRCHYFSGQSVQNCLDWITEINSASYVRMKHKMRTLQAKIMSITGQDPLESMSPSFDIPPKRYISVTRKRNSIDLGMMTKLHQAPLRPKSTAEHIIHRSQSGLLLSPEHLVAVDWNHFN